MKYFVHLDRISDDGIQTIGRLNIFQDEIHLFSCFTLELPWKDNKTNISCIPKGTYLVIPYKSSSKGDVYLLQNVENRSYIEFHVGNYYSDIRGCILVGDDLRDINHDGIKDVVNSGNTFSKMKKIMNYEEFKLVIS